MENSRDLEINRIVKYLNDEMTKEELKGFELWLKNNENLEVFKEYVVANHLIELGKDNFNTQIPIESFLSRIKKRKNKKRYQFLKYAAIFIGVIFSASYFFQDKNIKIENNNSEVTLELNDGTIQQIEVADKSVIIKDKFGRAIGVQKEGKIVYAKEVEKGVSIEEIEINTLRVPNGKKIQLILSDGTEIHLNSGSTLRYPSLFVVGNVRQVELEGEAFFKVAKNKTDAFIVKTNGISTEVFGTEFNVSSYENDAFAEVVLVEGSVGVFYGKERFDDDEDYYLAPNQIAKYKKNEKTIAITNVDANDYIAWINGVLLFKNESFKNIMKKLERHYNIEINIAYKAIENEKFTGQFDVENIENVLNTFKENTPFDFEIKENKITINP